MKKIYFKSMKGYVRHCIRLTAKGLAQTCGLTLAEISRPRGVRALRCRKGIAMVCHRQFLEQGLPITTADIDAVLNTITPKTNHNRKAR